MADEPTTTGTGVVVPPTVTNAPLPPTGGGGVVMPPAEEGGMGEARPEGPELPVTPGVTETLDPAAPAVEDETPGVTPPGTNPLPPTGGSTSDGTTGGGTQ